MITFPDLHINSYLHSIPNLCDTKDATRVLFLRAKPAVLRKTLAITGVFMFPLPRSQTESWRSKRHSTNFGFKTFGKRNFIAETKLQMFKYIIYLKSHIIFIFNKIFVVFFKMIFQVFIINTRKVPNLSICSQHILTNTKEGDVFISTIFIISPLF